LAPEQKLRTLQPKKGLYMSFTIQSKKAEQA